MKRLMTVQGLINELTYDLTMEELENLVIDSQDIVLEFIVNDAYNYKQKKLYNELCESIRSEKYFNTISLLINAEDERILPDMAYVLHMATNFGFVDNELKGEALSLGYMLRARELGEVVSHQATNTCIIIASTKAIRSYETTPFIRIKSVENILRNLPDVLYNAYHEEYEARQITRNVIFTILSKAVPDVTPAEIITAFCKSEFPNNVSKEIRVFALRLRAFFYELCSKIGDDALTRILINTCESIIKFNNRHNVFETFADKYLNYKLLEGVCNKENVIENRMMNDINKTYETVKKFKITNKKYSELF